MTKCRIRETFFTSIAVIGGKIKINHPKNMNHVHRDSKELVSVIITPEKNISGGYTVFYDVLKQTDLGKRAHVLKRLHVRMILGSFEIILHKGYLWRGNRAVIYFII